MNGGPASPTNRDGARVGADSSPYERANIRPVPLKTAWFLDKTTPHGGAFLSFRTAKRREKVVPDEGHASLETALHMAECVAHLMEAVAVSRETKGATVIDCRDAFNAIPRVHMCHIDAALIVIGLMLDDVGCDSDRWRRQIPKFTARVATIEHR